MSSKVVALFRRLVKILLQKKAGFGQIKLLIRIA